MDAQARAQVRARAQAQAQAVKAGGGRAGGAEAGGGRPAAAAAIHEAYPYPYPDPDPDTYQDPDGISVRIAGVTRQQFVRWVGRATERLPAAQVGGEVGTHPDGLCLRHLEHSDGLYFNSAL
jgi:hypothetical protein